MSASAPEGIYEFRMPSLGADMEAGTLLEWRVSPGDAVRRGDIVALVDTEKAEIEVEIFAAGVVEELIVREGQEVPVGALLARLRTAAAPAPVPPPRPPVPAPSAAAAPAAPAASPVARPPAPRPSPAPRRDAAAARAPKPTPTPAPVERPPASPSARRRARQLGLGLGGIAGSGPQGAITRADVEAAARASEAAAPGAVAPATAAPTPATATAAREPPRRAARPGGLRRALAAAMERSNQEIPHYYLSTDVDVLRARAWLDQANQERPIAERMLPAVLVLKAVALAARETPEMNGFWIDGAFRPGDGVHLAVAISRREGEVVVPAIHDVDALSLGELMSALRDLVRRARAGSLRSSELTDATLTVTNLGELGVSTLFGVIYPPQVALVGVGRIADRPRAVDGMIAVRPTATLSLAADHRASDGYSGARFLARIDALLQKPEAL